MKASESRMSLRILRVFRFHVVVLYPIGLDLILAAALSFRSTDQIYRFQRRLDFALFGILLLHDVSVANSFACRFDRERGFPIIFILQRIKLTSTLFV